MLKKNKQLKWLTLVALFLAVCGMIVSYVAMYTALDIEETNNVWAVNFVDLEESVNGTAKSTLPVVNSTSMIGANVQLMNKNDSVTYRFKVKNTGGVDARLKVINDIEPTCVEENSLNVACNNVYYVFAYDNGKKVATGDVLKAGTNMEIVLTVGYLGEEVVNISITDLELMLIYEQV